MSDSHEHEALTNIDKIACMSDAQLRRAYLETDGEVGDAWADALAQACEERGIDI